MKQPTPRVFVVDDDPLVRAARSLEFSGLSVQIFASACDFLEQIPVDVTGCVVLDLALPDIHGLRVQEALLKRGSVMPVIFLAGHADVATSVTAMKRGAAEFLVKPVSTSELVNAVREAIEHCAALQRERHEREDILGRYARLTARERDVLRHVVSGQLNKQIAADLGTLECTIKAHRGQVMRKMQARTLATLILLAVRAGILELDSRNKEATHERSTKVEYRSWSARGTGIATADLGHYSATS